MSEDFEHKTILITGVNGFLGSHLAEKLLSKGAVIIGVDNFISSERHKLEALKQQPHFQFIEADAATDPMSYLPSNLKVEAVYHLASPASPPVYQKHAMETYMVNSLGTHYLARWATAGHRRMVFASTSEVYGEPLEHPQKETYWGNVNPIGIRACYDEAKRFGEMVMMEHVRKYALDGRVVRIFNTYGPGMRVKDGRVISTLIGQALRGEPMTLHGDGTQTRSFCYVDDLIEYLIRVMVVPDLQGEVINIGNPQELSMLQVATLIREKTKTHSSITFIDRPADDPSKRKPDISKAITLLNYSPQISIETGLDKTILWIQEELV